MEIIDKVFGILFARLRHNLGDSNLNEAWRRANNKVSALILFPLAATTVVLMALIYSFTGVGTFAEHKRVAQIVGVGVCIAISMLLNRRFRKYLLAPPLLAPSESPTERQFLLRCQIVCVGVFIVTCLCGYLLHGAGVRLL